VLGRTEGREGMGQFGRITSLEDLPTDKVLLAHIRKAAEANEAGVKVPARTGFRSSEKPRLMVPDYFAAALKEDEQAQSNFERFSPSHKREYVEWVAGAKREETRQRRLRTAVAWIAQGKPQNWRYERC